MFEKPSLSPGNLVLSKETATIEFDCHFFCFKEPGFRVHAVVIRMRIVGLEYASRGFRLLAAWVGTE